MGGWMPGATLMRGHNAGYRAGRVIRSTTVAHYTAGVNSAGIGAQGYFNFLIRRNGEIVQFAESDAVTWHAGNWNSRGPGIEVEYYPPTASSQNDGPPPENIFTEVQLEACGRVVRWLHETDGYPLDFYDGPRISAHNGTITHRSLIQTGDSHHDYWSHDQWARMIEGDDVALTAADHEAFVIDAARGTAAAFGYKSVKRFQRHWQKLRDDAKLAAADDPDDRPETDEELRELLGLSD